MPRNFGLSPTPPSWDIPVSTGSTPKPTLSPLHQQHNGFLKRDTTVGENTCGWFDGDPNKPFTCGSSRTCVADAQYTAFACCGSTGDCSFATVCGDYNPSPCIEQKPGDCFHYDYTIGCIGDWGCLTLVVAGGVPFSLADCDYNTGTVYIQTTYTGGPANQQVPMPYSDFLVAVSSASSASAHASSTGNSDGSIIDTLSSNWISHHKALFIGVIVAAVALLLICCISCAIFRRKKSTRATSTPAPPVAPSPLYQYSPLQSMRERENYAMTLYQYTPSK